MAILFKMEPIPEPSPWPNRSFLSEFPRRESFFPAALFAVLCAAISLLCWQYPKVHETLVGRAGPLSDWSTWFSAATSLLVHSNIKHLLGNMMFLVPFGGLLTHYFGWRMFPLGAITLGILTQVITLQTYPVGVGLQGASGLLYLMFGLWLSLYYKAEQHVPASKRWLRIIGFCVIMAVPSEFSPQVSYRSHFIGLAIGLIVGIIYGFLNHDEFEQRNEELRLKETETP